ncbi:MAG: ABC transporter permease subunit [Deltaproteobacteria bacterium]|nr:ABC transporter permease subunit [Deltaproteobacteria bacterium]
MTTITAERRFAWAREAAIAARLDLAEVLRSRWLVFCVVVYLALAGILVLVGMKESTILGFTGMGRVMLAFSHALVLVLPLLALTATGQVVAHARDEGTLELLMSQPIRRGAWLAGVTVTRLAVLVVPLIVILLGMGIVAAIDGQVVPWEFIGRVALVATSLVWAFVGIGMAIAVLVRNQARAITFVVLTWALSVAFLDVGLVALMLKWRLDPELVFFGAALNPVQDARLALLSGLDPDLGTLGPVGFYLSTRIGERALFTLGVVWPAVLGTLAWLVALFVFRRRDVT